MPPIQGWFKARKLFQASQKVYYEDIFGENNPEEHLEGSHILDSESESDPEFFSRRARRQIRKESRNILRRNNKDQLDRREEMQTANGDETVAPTTDKGTGIGTADLGHTEESPLTGTQSLRSMTIAMWTSSSCPTCATVV